LVSDHQIALAQSQQCRLAIQVDNIQEEFRQTVNKVAAAATAAQQNIEGVGVC
jgi:hypothetical protein